VPGAISSTVIVAAAARAPDAAVATDFATPAKLQRKRGISFLNS